MGLDTITTLASAGKSMRSALDNAGVVDQYLAKEVGLKRVVGPTAVSMLPGAMVSSFGVISKPRFLGGYGVPIVGCQEPLEAEESVQFHIC